MWTISVLLKDPGKKQLVEDLLFLLSHNQRLWFLSKIKPDNTNFYNHHKPALGCFSEDKFYTKYYLFYSNISTFATYELLHSMSTVI